MVCRLYRWMIERALDAGGTVPPLAARHMQACASCRAFASRLNRLGRQLRDAPSYEISDEQRDRLQCAIMQRLEGVPLQTARPAGWAQASSFRYAVSAAAAVLISLLGVYAMQSRKPAPPDPLAYFAIDADMFQARISLLARLPEQSLQAEMQKLMDGARSAADFLGNCLPGAPTELDGGPNANTP